MPNHRCGKLNVSRTGLTRFELVIRELKSRALPLGDSPKNMAHIPSIILRRSQMPHLAIRYFSLSATRKSDMHRIDGAAFQHCPSFELQGIALCQLWFAEKLYVFVYIVLSQDILYPDIFYRSYISVKFNKPF